MRKVRLSLLGGVAALALVASPLGGADASAAFNSFSSSIDHYDLTNGQRILIEDENLTNLFKELIAADNIGEQDPGTDYCFRILNGEMVEDSLENDGVTLCVDLVDNDVYLSSDYYHDGVEILENTQGKYQCSYQNEAFNGCVNLNTTIFVGDLNSLDSSINPGMTINDYIVSIDKIFVGEGYTIIDGGNQTVDGSEDLVIHTTGNLEYLESVEIDGNALEEADYDAEDGGSVFVTIHADAIKALSKGKHTVKINFSEIVFNEHYSIPAGSVSTEFTYGENPDTADLPVETFIVFGSCLALGATSMAYMINKKSRR